MTHEASPFCFCSSLPQFIAKPGDLRFLALILISPPGRAAKRTETVIKYPPPNNRFYGEVDGVDSGTRVPLMMGRNKFLFHCLFKFISPPVPAQSPVRSANSKAQQNRTGKHRNRIEANIDAWQSASRWCLVLLFPFHPPSPCCFPARTLSRESRKRKAGGAIHWQGTVKGVFNLKNHHPSRKSTFPVEEWLKGCQVFSTLFTCCQLCGF